MIPKIGRWIGSKRQAIGASADAIAQNIRVNGQGGAISDTAAAAQSFQQLSQQVLKPGARFIGQGIKEVGTHVGQNAWKGAQYYWKNRNTKGMHLATAGATMALMPVAYNIGVDESKYQHRMNQVAGNLSVSNDGGGTFLRPNFSPQVEDMGATGDLVFALHNLRNGGQ